MLLKSPFSSLFSSILRKTSKLRRKRARGHSFVESLETRAMLSATAITEISTSSSVNTTTYIWNGSSFNSPVTTSIGINSTAAAMGSALWATGDVNGDGKEDLILLNPGMRGTHGFFAMPTQLEVALNNGSGGYGSWSVWDSNVPMDASSGGSTWANMKVGDFTGDGKADVLIQNKETGEWDLWTSSGSGFTKSVFGTWAPGVQWSDIIVGDFNGDGLMDIMGRQIANDPAPFGASSSAVDNWYVGLGSSSTSNRGTTGVSGNTWWLYTTTLHSTVIANAVAGDFNAAHSSSAHGIDDLAIRVLGATASDGSRPSSWWVYTTGTAGVTITASPNVSTSSSWNQANATGTEQNFTDVQVSDFNADGYDDIIARNASGQWVLSLGTLASGNAAVTSGSVAATWTGNFVTDLTVVGDFNGTHHAMLAVFDPSNFQWYTSSYSGSSFTTLAAAGGMTMSSATWKRNQVFVNGSNGANNWTVLDYQGNLGSNDALSPLEDIIRWYPNTSGDPAFVVGRYTANGSIDFQNFGGGMPSNESNPFQGATNVLFYQADFNADGLPDLLVQGLSYANSGEWYLLTNTGNSFVSTLITNIPQSWSAVFTEVKVSDFTGDGKADFLIMVQDTSTTAHWELYASTGTNFSTSVTVASFTSTTHDGWLFGGTVGDFDGDGKSDIVTDVWSSTNPNILNYYVAYSNGTSSWSIVNEWSRTNSTSPGGTRIYTIGSAGEELRVGNLSNTLSAAGYPIDSVLGLQNLIQTTGNIGQVWVGTGSASRTATSSGSWLNLPAPFDFSIPNDSYVFEVGHFATAYVNPSTGGTSSSDILINPDDNRNLFRVYTVNQSTFSSFVSTPAFTGPLGSYYGLLRPVVSDVNSDGFDDLVWGSTGYNVSLSVRADLIVVTTPDTGAYPGYSANWLGYTTTIPRLRSRRG